MRGQCVELDINHAPFEDPDRFFINPVRNNTGGIPPVAPERTNRKNSLPNDWLGLQMSNNIWS